MLNKRIYKRLSILDIIIFVIIIVLALLIMSKLGVWKKTSGITYKILLDEECARFYEAIGNSALYSSDAGKKLGDVTEIEQSSGKVILTVKSKCEQNTQLTTLSSGLIIYAGKHLDFETDKVKLSGTVIP